MNQLIDIFLDEHLKINNLFNEIINETNSLTRKNSLKKQLYALLAKHFSEEELLFKRYAYETGSIAITLQRMRKEHEFLINKMHSQHTDFSQLYKFLKIHEHIEEKTLYPALSETVSDKDMEEIMRVVILNP